MTREGAKEICEMIETHGIEVIKAYGEGKMIQHLNLDGEWVDCDMPISFSNNHSFRIKPESKYYLELTYDELDVVRSSLSAFILAKTNGTAQRLCRNILDDIEGITDNCPDVLCEDCSKDCEIKKIIEQVNESLDLDKITDEVEQDIKEQKIK